MSAFIVSDRCMNHVASGILDLRPTGLQTFAGIDLNDRDAGQRIGDVLFAMNGAAMIARYGDSELEPGGRYRPEKSAPVQCFKQTQCLLYQCAEGDVPETPLYQEIEAVTFRLAKLIIRTLPEYERAEWG